MAETTDYINNSVIEWNNTIATQVESTFSESEAFLAELASSMGLQAPYITLSFDPFVLPQISVTADAPERPNLESEIRGALSGIYRPNEPTLGEVVALPPTNIPDFDDQIPELNLPDIPMPEFPDIPVEPDTSVISPPSKPAISYPTVPTLNDIEFNTVDMPEKPDYVMPETPTLNALGIEDVAIPMKPDYNMPEAPVVNELVTNEIAIPVKPDYNMPEAPDIVAIEVADIAIPIRPEYELPAVPSLTEITIPAPMAIQIPAYTPNFPEADLPIPEHDFSWSEEEYISNLITAAQSRNLNVINNGGAGLGSEIETDMWQRQQERDEKLIRDTIDDLTAEYSLKAFDLPTGVLFAGHRKILSDYSDKRLDLGRDMTIEQARLALQNYDLAQKNGIQIESILIAYHSSRAERALQAAKATLEFGISIFNVKVQEYNAKVQAEVARSGIYDAQIKAEMLKADIFKSQIEAQRLLIDLDGRRVDIYRAQIAGLNEIQNLYKTDVDAAVARVSVEKLKLEAGIAQNDSNISVYKALLESLVIQSNLYKTDVEAAGLQVEIEKQKLQLNIAQNDSAVNIYKSNLEALTIIDSLYKTDIQAANLQVDMQKNKLQANISENDQQVNIYKALLESLVIIDNLYKTDVQAASLQVDMEKSKLQANISKNDESVKLYLSQIDAVNSLVKVYQTDMEATNLSLGMEKLNVDIFAKKIDAFSAQVAAQTAKYSAYKAMTEGETAKVSAYSEKARGYIAMVEGKKVASNMQIAELETTLKTNDQLIRKYEADTTLYRAGYANAMERVRASSSMYAADADIYRTEIQRAEAEARLLVEQSNIMQRQVMAQRDLGLKAAETNIHAYLEIAKLNQVTASAGGTLATSRVTALLNTISNVMHMSSQGTTNREEEITPE